MLLFSDHVSEDQDEAERKIPGEHPGIDDRRLIVRVKEKVGYHQWSQARQENDSGWQISCAAKKNCGQWRKICRSAGGACQGVADPVESDRDYQDQSSKHDRKIVW